MVSGTLEFEKIHETFRPKIQRYLARLVGEGEAEDLTQEVFVSVSQGLKTFKGESQLSTWIYRVATNAAIDRMRKSSFFEDARQDLFDESNIMAPKGHQPQQIEQRLRDMGV